MIIGINVVLSLALGAYTLPQLVGGLVAGAGATYLLRTLGERARMRRSTPYLIVAAVAVAFVLVAILRTAVA